MRKILYSIVFIIILGVSISAYASNQGTYSNGSSMYSNGTVEFYSNINDEGKLYKIDLSDMSEEKVLDEHVISMVSKDKYLYLLIDAANKSNLLKFNIENYSFSIEKEFDTFITNMAIRDNILYYLEEERVFAYNVDTNDVNIIIEDKNVDFIYFTEFNTLKCLVKNNSGYDTKIYNFNDSISELNEVPLFSAQSDNRLSLMSVSSYSPRLSEPSTTNSYYIHTSYGGLNECIHISGGSVLPNCVGYAWGRSYENLGSRPNLSKGDAGTWYDYNKNNGYYSYGKIPYLGAVAVWKKTGGSGHVAVVEVIDGDVVITSESGYNSSRWWKTTRSASNSNFSQSSPYIFQGFIYVLGQLEIVPPTITSALASSKSSVSLNWNSVPGATSYKIYRRTPGESWSGLSAVASTSSTSYTDNNLKNGQKYYYRVTAVCSSVESEQSETVAVYTLPTEPSALQATSIKKSGLTLSWKSVSGADKYNVYRRLPGESWAGRQPIGTVTSTSYTDSGLSAGTKYYYRVTAENDGGEGEQSESLDVYTAPTEPNLPVTTSIKDTSVAIKWNAVSSATSYNIYRRLAGESWAGLSPIAKTKSTSYTDSNVQKGTHYYYRVTAVNDYAEGEQSESLSVYTAYLISYNINGGTGNVPPQYKQYDKQLTLSTKKPTRTGYTFNDWNTKMNGSGTSYSLGDSYTANAATTLYAQWTANSYEVTFNANEGTTTTTSKTVTYDSTYGTLPTPSREGYSFKGWHTVESGGTEITSSSKVTITSAQTLYAQWEKAAEPTTQPDTIKPIGDYIDKVRINYTVNDKAVFTITSLDGSDLSEIKLFVAEYSEIGMLKHVKLGANSIIDNSFIITADLPASNNYKFMLWDKNQKPLVDAITNIR